MLDNHKSPNESAVGKKDLDNGKSNVIEKAVVSEDIGKQSQKLDSKESSKIPHAREDTTYASRLTVSNALKVNTTPPPSPSFQGPKWRLHVAESDTASDIASDIASDTNFNSGVPIGQTPHPTIDPMLVGERNSAYQSKFTTTVSWDEWDDLGGMLPQIDPIMAHGKRVTFEYQSLI